MNRVFISVCIRERPGAADQVRTARGGGRPFVIRGVRVAKGRPLPRVVLTRLLSFVPVCTLLAPCVLAQRDAGVGVRDLPNGFYVEWREGFWVATNFTERTLAAPVPAGAKILTGGGEVAPAGVTVWQE